MSKIWKSIYQLTSFAIALGLLLPFHKDKKKADLEPSSFSVFGKGNETFTPPSKKLIDPPKLSPSLTDYDLVKLKTIYKDYFPIGAAADSKPFLSDSTKSNFIASQYNSITPANQLKPTRIQPKEGCFEWKEADRAVEFAKKNKMKIRGHYLISSHNMPDWFFKDGYKAASKELVLQRMKTHIVTVMKRYRSDIYCWDVVNEAVSKDNNELSYRKKDKFYQIVGESYVEKAFEFAREADPNAILFYNENGFHIPEKRNRVYYFLKNLINKGANIDAVGMQSHMGIDGISEKMFRENIKIFSELGLSIQITELDISMFPSTKDGWLTAKQANQFDSEYTSVIQLKQALIYKMIFNVCRENKTKVTGITFWSPADWDNQYSRRIKKKAYQSIFDEKLNPKQAFYDIINLE